MASKQQGSPANHDVAIEPDSRGTIRDTLFNLLGTAVPLSVSIITIPLYLSVIGEPRFGVLALLWVLLGYFGLFEFGLSGAASQQIARTISTQSNERRGIYGTALIMNLGLGLIGVGVLWLTSEYLVAHVFKLESSLVEETLVALPWLLLALPVATCTSVMYGVLRGARCFRELNILLSMGSVLFQVIPLIVAEHYSPQLSVVLPAAVIARCITLIVAFEVCRRQICARRVIRFEKHRVKALFDYGKWLSINSFIAPIMVLADRTLIGIFTGSAEVARYAIAFRLGEVSTTLQGAVSNALFPRLAPGGEESAVFASAKGLKMVSLVVTPFTVMAIFFMDPILTYWIGEEFSKQTTRVAQILMLGFWVNGMTFIPFVHLLARGRPRYIALCYLIELPLYLLMLTYGLKYHGLLGAAVAFSARTILDLILQLFFSGLILPAIRSLLATGLMCAFCMVTAVLVSYGTELWWVLVVPQVFLVHSWCYFKLRPQIGRLIKKWQQYQSVRRQQ